MKALRSSVSASARRISGLSNGGLSRLMIRLALTLVGAQLADRLRRLRLDVLQQRHGDVGREGHVELAGDEGQDRASSGSG